MSELVRRESQSQENLMSQGNRRVVILNALPLNAFPYDQFVIQVERVTPGQATEVLKQAAQVESYVRHQGTLQVLNQLAGKPLPLSSGLYKFNPDDTILVVTLKSPQRGQEQTSVKSEDLEFFLVHCC